MTDQEINKAIAGHLGWKLYKFTWGGQSWTAMRPPGDVPESGLDSEVVEVSGDEDGLPPFTGDNIPNYSGDLNACAEFEATLNDIEQMDEYLFTLANIVRSQLPPHPPVSSIGMVFARVTAKASQRAAAFVQAIGKRKEKE